MGEGGFMADEYIERPQPEQSKSTEPEEQEWKDGKQPVGGWHKIRHNERDATDCHLNVVTAHGEEMFLHKYSDNGQETASYYCNYEFIPIPAKSTAERNHSELASLIESFSNLSAGIQANHILDWIENDMLKDSE